MVSFSLKPTFSSGCVTCHLSTCCKSTHVLLSGSRSIHIREKSQPKELLHTMEHSIISEQRPLCVTHSKQTIRQNC